MTIPSGHDVLMAPTPDEFAAGRAASVGRVLARVDSARDYGADWNYPGMSGAATLLTTTYGAQATEKILPTFVGATTGAYKDNTVVFSVILARLMLFSEATFKFQNLTSKKLYGNDSLRILEYPWPNGTTGELLARMEQDASLAGNAYIWNAGTQLVRLRPDWVTIVSREDTDRLGRPYRVIEGYFWDPSIGGDYQTPPQLFTVDEVAHWAPIPDPLANFRGMSWLTPVLREIESDQGLTAYKIQYMNNAATPNMMLKYSQKIGQDTIDRIRDQMSARHSGVNNAFKTVILDEGADLSVVGNTLEAMNFTTVQAAGENRIAAAGGVPGIVVGLKEGLMAATYSNYAQAMRRFADITMRPNWRSVCACLQSIIPNMPEKGVRLWFDVSDIAALRQGELEQAQTMLINSQAAAQLVTAGYELDSIVSALTSGDLGQLTIAPPKPVPTVLAPFVPGAVAGAEAKPPDPMAAAMNGKPMPAMNGAGGKGK